MTFEQCGENLALPCLHIGAGNPPSAEVRTLSYYHATLGIKLNPIGHAAGRAIHGNFLYLRVELHDVARLHSRDCSKSDVAEVNVSVRSRGSSFGKDTTREQQLKF